MARDGTVATVDGGVIRLDVETVCVHGDTRGAAQLAAAIRRALETEGVRVNAIGAN